jgi:SAM-dependent methyltransferase
VWPRCADAFATGFPSGSLDAVHARFMAAPCGRPEALLAEMARLLRPGGWMMLQEPVAESWAVPAAGEAWQRLKQLIRAGFEARGGHFDAGALLASQMGRACDGPVRLREVCHVLPGRHPYARLPLAFAGSLRPVWRASGLVEDDELDEVLAAVERALATPSPVTTFTLVQAWGQAAS